MSLGFKSEQSLYTCVLYDGYRSSSATSPAVMFTTRRRARDCHKTIFEITRARQIPVTTEGRLQSRVTVCGSCDCRLEIAAGPTEPSTAPSSSLRRVPQQPRELVVMDLLRQDREHDLMIKTSELVRRVLAGGDEAGQAASIHAERATEPGERRQTGCLTMTETESETRRKVPGALEPVRPASCLLRAVAVGFEPTEGVNLHALSRRAPSAARTRYRVERYRMTREGSQAGDPPSTPTRPQRQHAEYCQG
jgi:hypothetical protein